MKATSQAKTKYVRISPKKARFVAGLIRGKKVQEATLQLINSPTKAARLLKKTLDSAVANAESQLEVNKDSLIVDRVMIDGGPSWKRGKSKSRGGVVPILKRTSHFTVIVTAE